MIRDFGRELVVGGFRGYRWWRVGRGGWLESPFYGKSRWNPIRNLAECFVLRHGRLWFCSHLREEHEGGTPAPSCDCGFYGLHELPTQAPDYRRRHAPWELDPLESGDAGLVLGVAEAWGRVLIGTEGWRAQFCKPVALFVRARTMSKIDAPAIESRYSIPILSDLQALLGEWGPDRAALGIAAAV